MSPREKLVARTCLLLCAFVALGSVGALLAPPAGAERLEREKREADRRALDDLRVAAPRPPRVRPPEEPWFRSPQAPKR
ncbi:MAG: hypothetical protein ACREIU_06955 [Planctomycetota bacterium]